MGEYTCPHCKNPIYDDDALLCHFCGDSLERSSSGAMGRIKSSSVKWVAGVIAFVVIAAFLLLLLLIR